MKFTPANKYSRRYRPVRARNASGCENYDDAPRM